MKSGHLPFFVHRHASEGFGLSTGTSIHGKFSTIGSVEGKQRTIFDLIDVIVRRISTYYGLYHGGDPDFEVRHQRYPRTMMPLSAAWVRTSAQELSECP